MRTERFTFPGSQGGLLSARLDGPDGPPALATALFAHCFTCTKDILAANRVSAALVAGGIAVLRFDFTGLGSSEGEFANTGFSSNLDDLIAAADHLRGLGRAPALMIGHSLGGAAVLAAAPRIPEAKALCTIGAPFDTAHVVHQFAEAVPEIEARGEALVRLAGRPFTIRRSFLDDVRAQDQAARIAHLGRALLVLHSPVDDLVGIDNARAIFDAARHPKSFVSLDAADHLLTRAADAEYAAAVLAAWASRYIGADLTPATTPAPTATAVSVRETGRGRLQQEVRVGPYRLLADEPVAAGGLGSGPTPYDLLLAGLGACTAMTLRLYADGKGWPLEGVRVDLDHAKVHAADCAACETKEGRIDRIERRVALAGPLDPAQRARLLEIADKCPVHRTLHAEVLVETAEVEPSAAGAPAGARAAAR